MAHRAAAGNPAQVGAGAHARAEHDRDEGESRQAVARILLAEDDDGLRNVLAAGLRRAGHGVDAVACGHTGLAAVEMTPYDLLLLDVVMPGLDGIALARRAGRRWPGIKVVFITGFAAVALSPRSEAPVGARVLSKPFHLNDLAAQVEDVLAGSPQPLI
jgi:two-component system cell cycle response regulator CpdR